MGVNSFPKTVTRQHRGCDLNPGLTVLESSTLTNHSATEPPWVSVNRESSTAGLTSIVDRWRLF